MPTIQIEDGISLEDYLLDLLVEVAVTPTIDAVLGGRAVAPVAVGQAGSLRAMLAVGAEAPHSTFTAHDGSTVRVRDLRGRWVLVWWYPKAATPG